MTGPSHARTSSRRLLLAAGIAAGVLVLEVVGGVVSHSLALLSDAGHVLADLLALGMTLFALRLAERPISDRATFGYHRVGVLVALLNGLSLVAIAGLVVREAYARLLSPPSVNTTELLAIAGLGLAANVAMLGLLGRGHRENLNVRSAWLHVIGDSLGSAGVIVSAVIMATTGWRYADPIASVAIAGLVLLSGAGVVRDAVRVLLELPPHLLRPSELERSLAEVEGVRGVHDLHLWAITPEFPCLSAHLVVDEQPVSQAERIVRVATTRLKKLGVRHATLQVEFEGCDPSAGSCAFNVVD